MVDFFFFLLLLAYPHQNLALPVWQDLVVVCDLLLHNATVWVFGLEIEPEAALSVKHGLEIS